MVRAGVVAAALLIAVDVAAADTPPSLPYDFPEYAAGDPYYSDAFDAFKLCAAKQAPSYRYDYDRAEVSSAEQVAAWLRRTCSAEIAALAKLVSPQEKTGGPEEMTGALDAFVVEPFFRQRWAAPIPAAVPGTSVLSENGRTTHFRAAHGFGADEIVSVTRTDAFDAPNYYYPFGNRFRYSGHREGWAYSYRDVGSGILYGSVSRDSVTATAKCATAYRGVVSWGDHCELKVERLITLGSRGKRLYPLGLCNPGDEPPSDVLLRPPSAAPRGPAWQATLSIDGGAPVAIPNGARCLPLSAEMLARVIQAKRLHSSFIGEDDTRTTTADGDGEVVGAGLPLLERLHALTFDKRVASEMAADQQTLYHRALPFTVRDALLANDEWHGTVACVAKAARRNGGAVAIDAAMKDAACADWLGDVEWRAASFRSRTTPAADNAAGADDGPAKIAEVRALVRNEAAAFLAQGLPQPRLRFADNETATSVMGHAGFSGWAETTRERSSGGAEPFGYAIEGRRAWGVIPSVFFNGYNGDLPPQSIVIACDGTRVPACTIRIPTDDRKGAFELHTAGTWHGAATCLAYAQQQLAGWRIYVDSYADADRSALLDQNGCVTERQALIARAVLEQSVGPVLVEPGGKPDGKDEMLTFQNVKFALALARFLAERVAE